MTSLLVSIVVTILIAALLTWVVSLVPMPPAIKRFLPTIIWVIAVIVIILKLVPLA